MSFKVTCPNCAHEFQSDDAMKTELRNQMVDWQRKKDDEFRVKEQQFQQQMQEKEALAQQAIITEREKIAVQMEQQVRQQLQQDYELQMKHLHKTNAENEEKLRASQQKELYYIQREQEIISKEKELDLTLQTQLLEERNKLTGIIRLEEEAKLKLTEQQTQLKIQELEMKLEQQKKLAEEMKRKAEQGSMQLQGEAQELILEELLRSTFATDMISEVGKGVRGADCIQTVRNSSGQVCGKIIYESKRTATFGADWIEKLKSDMRSQGAELAVLVTHVMPKDMNGFGEKDGVWICNFQEVRLLANVLRQTIMKVYNVSKYQENKGDKMTMIYDYVTGREFSEQIKAVREGFHSMQSSIQRERDQMEKNWKMREKQIEKVLLNLTHISGSIEGLAGADAQDIGLLEEGMDES